MSSQVQNKHTLKSSSALVTTGSLISSDSKILTENIELTIHDWWASLEM